MKADQFCYWLQGLFENSPDIKQLTEHQTQNVKNHLSLVFLHDLDPKEEAESGKSAETLQAAHDGSDYDGLAELDKIISLIDKLPKPSAEEVIQTCKKPKKKKHGGGGGGYSGGLGGGLLLRC